MTGRSSTPPPTPGLLARLLTLLPGVYWTPPASPQSKGAQRKDGRREDGPPLHIARAELVLAQEPHRPLKRLPVSPDPLHEIAAALTGVTNTPGESFELHLDLLPISPARQHQMKNQIVRADSPGVAGRGQSLREGLRMVAYGVDSASTRSTGQGRATPARLTALQRTAVNHETRDLGAKVLAVDEPWWDLQLLLVSRSPKADRARQRLNTVIAALAQFSDENRLQVVGQRLGPFYLGSDLPGRRTRFDRRVRTGLFAPVKPGWVTTGEVAGFLKPPTRNLSLTNIARGGGPVPPPPRDLPTYRGPVDRHLLPQGWIRDDRGWRPVGVPLADTHFELLTGKSRSGKSERAITQFVHLALAGHGGMYLDPHVQALERMKPYLGSVADRILEINLSKKDTAKQAGFNLLSMAGRSRADIEGRISAVVAGFSAGLSWSNVNNRAQTLVTQSVWSLCEIGLKLPPELQPTIFQITSILSSEEWRAALLPHLPRDVAAFWQTRFNNLEKSAITPVTNLLDRLRSSPSVAALLGSSQSTYDARRAMDEGKIVLASPAGAGDKDRFVAAFLLYDVFLAALSRQDTGQSMAQLKPFYLFVDEMQIYDTAGSVLELMLRETAKYGLKVAGATQSLTVLQKNTQDMWLTNRSHVISSAERMDAARILAKEMGELVDPRTISRLEQYCSIGQVTLNKQATAPFWMRGFDLTDVFAEYADPQAPAAIAAAVDQTMHRKPVQQTIQELDVLDERIAAYLSAHIPRAQIELHQTPPSADPSPDDPLDPPATTPVDSTGPGQPGPGNVTPLDGARRPGASPTRTRWE